MVTHLPAEALGAAVRAVADSRNAAVTERQRNALAAEIEHHRIIATRENATQKNQLAGLIAQAFFALENRKMDLVLKTYEDMRASLSAGLAKLDDEASELRRDQRSERVENSLYQQNLIRDRLNEIEGERNMIRMNERILMEQANYFAGRIGSAFQWLPVLT